MLITDANNNTSTTLEIKTVQVENKIQTGQLNKYSIQPPLSHDVLNVPS